MNRIFNHLKPPVFPDGIKGLFVLGGNQPKYIGSMKELFSWVGNERIDQIDETTWTSETFTIFPIFPHPSGSILLVLNQECDQAIQTFVKNNVPFMFQPPNMVLVLGCIHAFMECFD